MIEKMSKGNNITKPPLYKRPIFSKLRQQRGSSSVGRARPSQGRCRGFEPLFPLEKQKDATRRLFVFMAGVRRDENPRRGFGSSDQGESRKKDFFYAEPPERTSKTSQNCLLRVLPSSLSRRRESAFLLIEPFN